MGCMGVGVSGHMWVVGITGCVCVCVCLGAVGILVYMRIGRQGVACLTFQIPLLLSAMRHHRFGACAPRDVYSLM